VPLSGVPAEPPALPPFLEQLLAVVTRAGFHACEPQAAAGHDRSSYLLVPSYEFPPCNKSKSNLSDLPSACLTSVATIRDSTSFSFVHSNAATAVNSATSSALTWHLRACPSFLCNRAASQHGRSAQRYAPRPERLPLGSTSMVPSGVRTIRINSRLGRFFWHTTQLRSGTCFRRSRDNSLHLLPTPAVSGNAGISDPTARPSPNHSRDHSLAFQPFSSFSSFL
jgi:hypothetical protein